MSKEENFMVEFGEQLRRIRESKGMTQQTLADQLYVTRQTVSRWECGNRYPDLITAKKLASFLEVSLDELLSDDEMKIAAEKSSVIEKPIINKLLIVLYACISFSFALTVVDILIRFSTTTMPVNYHDMIILGINVVSSMVQMILFGYGFIMTLKGNLTPKKTGIVVTGYLLSVCLTYFARIADSNMIIRAFVFSLPFVVGAIASFNNFCKKANRNLWFKLLCLVALWGIILSLYSVYTIIKYAPEYVSTNVSLNMVLKICIYFSIIYQAFILKQKRKQPLFS
jgi:transcriptional regulator with XRE-family HTH domain